MYTIFEEYGIKLPERDCTILVNPDSLIMCPETNVQLGVLLQQGYELVDILHNYNDDKKAKLGFQTELSTVSRRIIRIYQQCVNSERPESRKWAGMAASFIILMMIPVIKKYLLLLTSGTDTDLNTQDTRNFLALYATPNNVRDPERRKYIHQMKFRRHLPEDVFLFMKNTVRGLRLKLYFMEPNEIYDELCYLILRAAMKFNTELTLAFWFYLTGGRKRKGGDGTFKYMVRTFIARQSGNFTYSPITSWHEKNALDVGLICHDSGSPAIELDLDWVLGKAISAEYDTLFSPLTEEQREILRRWYDDTNKTNPTEIGREMGMARQKVEEEHEKAIKHLADTLGYEL